MGIVTGNFSMTDFELNKAIAKKLGLNIYAPDVLSEGVWTHVGNPMSEQLKDYCNNWNDLMPLVLDNHIQIYIHSKDHYNIDDKLAVHKCNVQRVLAECSLESLTSES